MIATADTRRWTKTMSVASRTAPALLFIYGILTIIDGRDGEYGPGFAYTAGHFLFLAGLLLFAPVLIGLRRMVPASSTAARVGASALLGVSFAGLFSFLRIAIKDIVVGVRGTSNEHMDVLSDKYDSVLGFLPAPYLELGPVLLQLGLIGLVILLAAKRPRHLPVWSPVLIFLGFAVMSAELNLLPIGAVLLAGGMWAFNGRPLADHNESRNARIAVPVAR